MHTIGSVTLENTGCLPFQKSGLQVFWKPDSSLNDPQSPYPLKLSVMLFLTFSLCFIKT